MVEQTLGRSARSEHPEKQIEPSTIGVLAIVRSDEIQATCAHWAAASSCDRQSLFVRNREGALPEVDPRRALILVIEWSVQEAPSEEYILGILSRYNIRGMIWIASDEERFIVFWRRQREKYEHLVCGFATKEDFLVSPSSFLNATTRGLVLLSREFFPSRARDNLLRKLNADSESYATEQLSPREVQILSLASKGLTQKEISAALDLSVHTISGYFKSAYSKLQVSTRSEAIFEARALGLLDTYLNSRI